MKKYIPQMILAMLIAVFWQVGTAPNGLAENQRQDGEIRVGYSEFPPYSFTDENGNAQGYSIDIWTLLARDMGRLVTFVPTHNPQGILDALGRGDIDATTLLAKTESRQQSGLFSMTFGSFETSVFVLKKSGIASVEDLEGARVAAIAGSYGATVVRKQSVGIPVDIGSYAELAVALLDGSVDAVVAPTEMFIGFLRRLQADRLVTVLQPALSSSERGFLIHPRLDHLRTDVDAALGRITSEVTTAFQERWFGQPTQINETPLWALGALAGLCCLMCVVLGLSIRQHRKTRFDLEKHALLIDALNQIDLAIVIYDANGRTVHWNAAMASNFPALTPLLISRANVVELITYMHVSGHNKLQFDEAEARRQASEIADKMKAGEDTTRVVHIADGRVFEAREIRLGDSLFASIRTDITKIESQAEQIRLQNNELKSGYERMQRFSAMAAHDLRAPLNQQAALLSFIFEALQEADTTLSDDTLELMRDAETTVGRMRRLIDDLLEYARRINQTEHVEDFDSTEVIADVLSLVDVPPGFSIDYSPDLPRICAPRAGFSVVVRNLINNSIHHHHASTGEVSIKAEVREDLAVFSVSDDGPGIPEKFRHRIFEPFERLDRNQSASGSGLGLALVAQAVVGWGGNIDVFPRPGGGTLFRFTAPLATPQKRQGTSAANVVPLKYRA